MMLCKYTRDLLKKKVHNDFAHRKAEIVAMIHCEEVSLEKVRVVAKLDAYRIRLRRRQFLTEEQPRRYAGSGFYILRGL